MSRRCCTDLDLSTAQALLDILESQGMCRLGLCFDPQSGRCTVEFSDDNPDRGDTWSVRACRARRADSLAQDEGGVVG